MGEGDIMKRLVEAIIYWLGWIVMRVWCMWSGHFPHSDRIAHLRKVGILDKDETTPCVYCGKELR